MENWLQELDDIYKECQVKDWGGDGEHPLEKHSYEECKQFLKLLPVGLKIGIVPYPNGLIGIDFTNARHKLGHVVFDKEYIVWCRSVYNNVESGQYNKSIPYVNHLALAEVLKIYQ